MCGQVALVVAACLSAASAGEPEPVKFTRVPVARKANGKMVIQFVVSREKNVTGYQDHGLKRDTRYYYRVRALGLRGVTSKFTPEILITTPLTRRAPGD